MAFQQNDKVNMPPQMQVQRPPAKLQGSNLPTIAASVQKLSPKKKAPGQPEPETVGCRQLDSAATGPALPVVHQRSSDRELPPTFRLGEIQLLL